MHELAIANSILSLALAEAQKLGGKRVIKIDLALGEMSGLAEESLGFHFDIVSRGTIAAGAKLSFRCQPGRESYIEGIEVE